MFCQYRQNEIDGPSIIDCDANVVFGRDVTQLVDDRLSVRSRCIRDKGRIVKIDQEERSQTPHASQEPDFQSFGWTMATCKVICFDRETATSKYFKESMPGRQLFI